MALSDQKRSWQNLEGFTDAQGQNASARGVRVYSDLDLFFGQNNRTKDINVLTDAQAVKRSVRNLILLNTFEKPFHPEIGSGVRDTLFENMTPVTAIILSRHIEDVIRNFEPRARLVGVYSFPNLDKNQYDVTIEFYIINTPTELVELTLPLERLR